MCFSWRFMIFLYHKTSWSTGHFLLFSVIFWEKVPGILASRIQTWPVDNFTEAFLLLPSFSFQVRGHGSRVILPCCNQSNQSVSRLISVPVAVKVDQEESVEFCDSHSSSAPFEPNVIWRLHTNPRRGKRLYLIQCIIIMITTMNMTMVVGILKFSSLMWIVRPRLYRFLTQHFSISDSNWFRFILRFRCWWLKL